MTALPTSSPDMPGAGEGKGMLFSTRNDHRPPAIVCRERGWTVGTRLVGDEGYGPTVIRITAIGEGCILAIAESGPGSRRPYETLWGVGCRDWQPLLDTAVPHGPEDRLPSETGGGR